MNSKSFLLAMQALSLQMRRSHRKPFPFLKLPKELRLMIYEYAAHLHRHDEVSILVERNRATVTLVTPLPIPPIHLACRLIHSEASPVLQKRLQQSNRTVPRIVIPAAHVMWLAKYDGLIHEILYWLHHVRFTEDLLPSKDMKEELETRFPSIGPNPTFATASIARLANIGGVHIDVFSEKFALFDWARFRRSECRIFKKLAKERECSLTRKDMEMKLHILVKDGGEMDLQPLLTKLSIRARDFRTHITVYRVQKGYGENVCGHSHQPWATDGGVVNGKEWLENWA